MILSGNWDTNQLIYSYLNLKTLRLVSKAIKSEVERIEGVVDQKHAKWDVAIQAAISDTKPGWMHADEKKLRILSFDADQF